MDFTLFVVVFLVGALPVPVGGVFEVINRAGVSEKRIVIPGDLMIGMLTSINQETNEKNACATKVVHHRLEASMLIANAIREANAANYLNGTKVGLVVYDTCDLPQFAIAQSYRFLPTPSDIPLIGVICCHKSELTLPVASLLSAYKIPQIGTFTTMDILSDKNIYEYFLRLSPPNKFQIAAIVDLIRYFDWNYVSVLFEDGEYGEDILKLLEIAAEEGHFCLAQVHRIRKTMTDGDYRRTVEELLQSKARVVILAIRLGPIKRLMPIAWELSEARKLLWLGTDSWGSYAKKESALFPAAEGALLLTPRLEYRPELNKFYDDMVTLSQLNNGWWPGYLSSKLGCASAANCAGKLVPDNLADEHAAIHFDAVDLLLRALRQYHPRIRANLSAFSTADFFAVLKALRYEGKNGPIQFTREGDIIGNFLVYHVIRDNGTASESNPHGIQAVQVGEWDAARKALEMVPSLITWLRGGRKPPASNCSEPCREGEIIAQMTPFCCWNCFRCRDNEVTAKNRTECSECPEFTWPEPRHRLTCEYLDLSYVHYGDVLGVVIIGFASIGFSLTCAVIVIFAINNDKRLVRSTCREASYILLAGILVDFSIVALFPGEPSEWKCFALRYGFHLGCAMTYGPILIKTAKVFRIFVAGKHSTKAPKFIGPAQQFVAIVAIVAVEASIVAGSKWYLWPKPVRIMPVKTEPLVEFTCQESLHTLLIGFSFNLVIILCSAVLAVMARKLPANFNESMQIVICVYTTLILWVALIPSYVTTPRASNKAMLLAVAIGLNGFVPLLSLFGPKVYALYYVKETTSTGKTLQSNH